MDAPQQCMSLPHLLSLPTRARELILGGKFIKHAVSYRVVCKDFKDAFDSTVSEAHLKLGEEAVERWASGQASPLARFPSYVSLTLHLEEDEDPEVLIGLALFGTAPEARQQLTRVRITKADKYTALNTLCVVEALLAAQLSGLEELELENTCTSDHLTTARSSARTAIVLARLAEGLPRLRRLRLPLPGSHGLVQLRSLSSLAQLRELILVTGLAGGLTTSDGLAALQQLSQLEQLALLNFDLPSERSIELVQQLMSDRRPSGVRRLTFLRDAYPFGGACITYQRPHPSLAVPSTAAATRFVGAGAAAAAMRLGPSSALAAAAAAAPGAPLCEIQRVELNGRCNSRVEIAGIVGAAADRLGQRSIPELVIKDIDSDGSASMQDGLAQLVARCERVEWRCLNLWNHRLDAARPLLALLGLPQSLRLSCGKWSWRDDVMGGGRRYRQAAAAATAAAAGAATAAGAAGSAGAEQPPRPPLNLDLGAVDPEWVVREVLDRLWARGLGKQAGQGGDACSSDDSYGSVDDSDGSDDDSGSASDSGSGSGTPSSGSSSSGAAAAAGGSSNGSSSAHVGGVGPALMILRGVLPSRGHVLVYDDVWDRAVHKCFGSLDPSSKRLVNDPGHEVMTVPLTCTAVVGYESRTDAAAVLALLRPGMEKRVAVVPLPPGESTIPIDHLRQCVSEVRCMGWRT